jgi:hypothetical protein
MKTSAQSTPEPDDGPTYSIVRFYEQGESEVVRRGLTKEEAREHCNDPESSSYTATSREAIERTVKRGKWFDGRREE